MTAPAPADTGREAPRASRPRWPLAGPQRTGTFLTKLVLVGLIDALLIVAFVQALSAQWWLAVVFFAAVAVAVNLTYFSGRALPLKYLVPGLVFLVAFQLYTMAFTTYASFTNYGTSHLTSKSEAITSIQATNVVPVEGGKQYAVVPIRKDGQIAMLLTNPETGSVQIGTNEGLTEAPADEVQRSGTQVVGLLGWESLNLASLSSDAAAKAQWDELRPPIDKANGTYLRPVSITRAAEAKSGLTYDESTDTMTNSATGEVYRADESVGSFVSDSGDVLKPGWRVGVGVSNYVTLFTDATIRSHFIPIAVWTFAFAIITTFLNFSIGLLLALILNDNRMRFKGFYRALLIVPYGLPAILTALVWKGMLNTDFGLINQILGSNIEWLTQPNLARFSVLMVNLWMGFPYFFLVCSGALTAIPGDLKEAAFVDGASGRYAFRTVVLPLLLVATAPLLVTTFAFNFNNYALIELLTQGGPFPGSISDGGSTDLLINYTFRTAFNGTNQQLGLASAIAMIIFVIVGTVSAFGFRLTRKLEEIRQ